MQKPANLTIPRLSLPAAILVGIALIGLAAWILYWMGRIPICKCGTVKLWYGGRGDSEMSQHLTDWYSYSHVLHGIIFYWLRSVISKRRLAGGGRVVAGIG